MQTASIPAFLDYDAAVAQYWPRLAETFPDYQFCLAEKTSGAPVARGHSIPVAFNSSWSSLPDEGFDWALERGFLDHIAGRKPTVLSALYVVVSDHYRGRGLSSTMLATMKQIGL